MSADGVTSSAENSGVDLGDLADLVDGELRAFPNVGDTGVVVCRVAGKLYAIEDNCSHADTPLSEGRLRGHLLVCPLHGAAFDVRDGTHQSPPAWEGVSCFAVHEGHGGAIVEFSTRSEPSDLRDPDSARLRTR